VRSKPRYTETPLADGTAAPSWRTDMPVQLGISVRGRGVATANAFHNGTVRPNGIPGGVPG
jgi:hypothetical protein